MTVNELTYFPVSGHWYDVEAPDTSASTNTPQFLVISAFVTFTPRLKPGTVAYITNLDLGAQLPPPSGLTITPSTTGGTLPSGAHYWTITSTNPNGETTKSNEVTATLTGSTSSAVLTWTPDNASTHKVYRGTTTGGENVLVATITPGSTLTYTDTGTAGTSATPPTTNTAELSANTAIAMPSITGRILEGELQTINRDDTPMLQLLANSDILGLTTPLIYDVAFSNVVYASSAQTLQNFAFTAPTDTTPIDLTDPALTRLEYNPTNY